jgi:hypothetical protein
MDKASSLQFLSKECKGNQHSQCHSRWEGLAIEVSCSCECHKSNDSKVILLQDSTHIDNHKSHANTERSPLKQTRTMLLMNRTSTADLNLSIDKINSVSKFHSFCCSGCFANAPEECICDRIEAFDPDTGYPIISINETEWKYLHSKKRKRSVIL